MEGCLGSCGERSESPETVRRWAESVNNVLSTIAGRKRFQDFLINQDTFDSLEEGAHLITFWEMCHELVPDEESISKQEKKSQDIFSAARGILRYADENNINLDTGILKGIHNGVKRKKYEETMAAVLRAKQEVNQQLVVYHDIFKKDLQR